MLRAVALLGLATIVLFAIVVIVAVVVFDTAIRGEVARLRGEAMPGETPVSAEQLAALPPPAQRYFARAGIVAGSPIPRLVTVRQKGRIRSSTASGWMAFEAEETYSTNPPAFVWRAWFPNRALPIVLGRDFYLDGRGGILMKMLGLVAVADEHGDELRAAGLMRYLNEMAWFPAAYLGDNVAITPVDDDSFKVAITDKGITAEGVLIVDTDGRLLNFRARRFNTGSRSMETWETPLAGEATLGGLLLPSGGAAVWKLFSGDLDYIELDITALATE